MTHHGKCVGIEDCCTLDSFEQLAATLPAAAGPPQRHGLMLGQ
jgi:hypothetical protein